MPENPTHIISTCKLSAECDQCSFNRRCTANNARMESLRQTDPLAVSRARQQYSQLKDKVPSMHETFINSAENILDQVKPPSSNNPLSDQLGDTDPSRKGNSYFNRNAPYHKR